MRAHVRTRSELDFQLDDFVGLGQTAAAHDCAPRCAPHLRRHRLQANVGHYGVFSGRRRENEI